ncbi:MAG: substrate-binding domain-containing protein [Eubacterium sp.]
MRKKNLIVSAVSLICMVCLVIGVVSGCGKDKAEPTGDASSSAVTGAITVISREDGSGTRDAFTELMDIVDADGNDATVQTAEITNSTSVMMSTVKGNAKSIGYVSLGSLSDTVKAVSIDGVAPSVETVKDGSYKLQRPFKIAYIDGTLSDTAKDFLSFIMSTEGEKIIGEEGYIGLDATDTYQPSGVSGTVSLAGSTSVAPVMNVLADKYKQLNPDVKIEIQESGSSAGIESALQGAVDIAMSSRELKEDEAKALKAETIALDGIAVIVNAENDIDNLTSQQIKSIFNGEIKVWEDVK